MCYTRLLSRFSFMLIFCLVAMTAYGQLGKKKYQEGEEAYKVKKWEDALRSYKEAIELEPTQYRYHMKKAKAEAKLKRYDDAIKSLEKSVELNPGNSSGYLMLSKLYQQVKKDNDKALSYLNQAYEKDINQHNKLAYKLQAVKLLLKMGKAEDANKELQAAKSINANDIRVIMADGEVSGELGQWQQALNSYESAMKKAEVAGEKGAALGKYQYKVALAHFKLGNQAKYKEIETELCRTNQNYCKLLKKAVKGAGATTKNLKLAQAYNKAGDYDQALKFTKEAIDKNESPARAHQQEGSIYSKTGQYSQAISSYAKAVDLEKDEATKLKINQVLLKLQFNNRDYNGALTTANRILEKKPNDVKVLHQRAIAQYHLQQYDGCIQSCEKAVSLIPGEGDAEKKRKAPYFFTMGLAAKKAGNNNKAKEAFAKADIGTFRSAARAEAQALGAK